MSESCDHYPGARDIHVVNFGALPPLPSGWHVAWHESFEMYMGHGPDGWESAISWNRFWVRSWTMEAALSTPPPAAEPTEEEA